MSETALIDVCLKLLRLHGAFAWRNNSGAVAYGGPGQRQRFVRYGLPGSADILAILDGGRFAAIECKRGRTVVTARQGQFMAEVQSRGGLAMVVRDVSELEAELVRSASNAAAGVMSAIRRLKKQRVLECPAVAPGSCVAGDLAADVAQ